MTAGTVERLPAPGEGWAAWFAWSAALTTRPGVHRPSRFSALLAAAVHGVEGRVVVDAGCGAGLATLAALQAGAAHVVATDIDASALADTRDNVARHLGPDASSRVSLWRSDFSALGSLPADVLLVNPPQRPAALLAGVDPADRHLHTGGGADGLDTHRLVLRHAGAVEVWATVCGLLPVADLLRDCSGRLDGGEVLAAELPLHPSWLPLAPGLRARVTVMRFRRSA